MKTNRLAAAITWGYLLLAYLAFPEARHPLVASVLGCYGTLAVTLVLAAVFNWFRARGVARRQAETSARMDAVLRTWETEDRRVLDADWFNHDGPYTIAGQPR